MSIEKIAEFCSPCDLLIDYGRCPMAIKERAVIRNFCNGASINSVPIVFYNSKKFVLEGLMYDRRVNADMKKLNSKLGYDTADR